MTEKKERIYCAEQINVPYDLPSILKHYSKEIIEKNPENIIAHSAKFFKELVQKRQLYGKDTPLNELIKLDPKMKLC